MRIEPGGPAKVQQRREQPGQSNAEMPRRNAAPLQHSIRAARFTANPFGQIAPCGVVKALPAG